MTNSETATKLRVPMRQYFRPDGRSTLGFLNVQDAYTDQRAETIDTICKAGIEFTLELDALGNAIICMDNGTFDYKIEIVPKAMVGTAAVRLIDNFDKEDYRAMAAAHEAAENAMVPWAEEG